MDFIDIPEQTLSSSTVVSKLRISVVSLVLGTQASFQIEFFEVGSDSPFSVKYYKLEGEEYNLWGADDNYIVDIILSKYGLSLTN